MLGAVGAHNVLLFVVNESPALRPSVRDEDSNAFSALCNKWNICVHHQIEAKLAAENKPTKFLFAEQKGKPGFNNQTIVTDLVKRVLRTRFVIGYDAAIDFDLKELKPFIGKLRNDIVFLSQSYFIEFRHTQGPLLLLARC